jgi:isopenicillin N synthase-like dioxygenase
MRDEAMSIPVVSLEPIIGASANADETVATDLKAALGSWGAFELVGTAFRSRRSRAPSLRPTHSFGFQSRRG